MDHDLSGGDDRAREFLEQMPNGRVSVAGLDTQIVAPHATYVNTTDEVRKAYIVQYVPDDAVALHGDPTAPSALRGVRQDDPDRQFSVVTKG